MCTKKVSESLFFTPEKGIGITGLYPIASVDLSPLERFARGISLGRTYLNNTVRFRFLMANLNYQFHGGVRRNAENHLV